MRSKGGFEIWERVNFKMKKVWYSPVDKLKTLWAWIVIGCEHTVETNTDFRRV
jgi:lysozyme family protein